MNLLCIAVDRLHVGYLGCYGNTWVATPALDRLASSGFVFDQALVDMLDPAEAYESWWRGSHFIARKRDAAGSTFAGLARRAGLKTLLVADDAQVLEHAAGVDFDEVLEVLPPEAARESAEEVAETHTARLFAEAGDRLIDLAEKPFAMWLHVGALGGTWDAPLSFRERYRDDDDPPLPTFTQLPDRSEPPELDLDERFGYAQAYAGQVTLLDACLGGLLQQLEESQLDADTAVMVCGLRGLALGEHGVVGHQDDRLYAENIHVPWLVRLPGGRGRLRRSQALVQPGDFLPTAADWLGIPLEYRAPFSFSLAPLIDAQVTTVRDRAPSAALHQYSISTSRWRLRSEARPGGSQHELFAKPDDFWEVNDVADRCAEVVEALNTCHNETWRALDANADLPPLPEAERMLEA